MNLIVDDIYKTLNPLGEPAMRVTVRNADTRVGYTVWAKSVTEGIRDAVASHLSKRSAK